MCRSLLAYLSTSPVLRGRFPWEHIFRFHIHLGYFFCGIMITAVGVFFFFFGKVCSDHLNGLDPVDTCRNFSREIMFTGYAIFVCTVVLLLSSYLRSRYNYRIFYWGHIFFVYSMYLLAILHTLDDEFRAGTKKGKLRSQTFIWFSSSLAVYFGDRIWSISAEKRTTVLKAEQTKDQSGVLLYIRKPADFQFEPGQHAMLQIPAIDLSWHPFSIASGPQQEYLLFFISVSKAGACCAPKPWSARLFDTIQFGFASWKTGLSGSVDVKIRGPYGAPVVPKPDAPSLTLLIGSGSGIVPMLSMLQHRIYKLSLTSKEGVLQEEVSSVHVKRPQLRPDQDHSPLLRSLILQKLQLQWRLRDVRRRGHKSTLAQRCYRTSLLSTRQYWFLLTLIFVLLDTALTPLAASWANMPDRATRPPALMADLVQWSTVGLGAFFIFHRCLWRSTCGFRGKVDAAFLLDWLVILAHASVLAFWLSQANVFVMRAETAEAPAHLDLSDVQQLLLLGFGGYRVIRLLNGLTPLSGARGELNKPAFSPVHMVWITRSPMLLLGYLPEIKKMSQALQLLAEERSERKAVYDDSGNLVSLQIFCTNRDAAATAELRARVDQMGLSRIVHIGERPCVDSVVSSKVSQYLKSRFTHDDLRNRAHAHKMLCAFCGSPNVAKASYRAVGALNRSLGHGGIDAWMETLMTYYPGNLREEKRRAKQEAKHGRKGHGSKHLYNQAAEHAAASNGRALRIKSNTTKVSPVVDVASLLAVAPLDAPAPTQEPEWQVHEVEETLLAEETLQTDADAPAPTLPTALAIDQAGA